MTSIIHADRARGARRRADALKLSWLDARLALRMLVRYPVLTVVGGLAIAFAICIGAVAFELITQVIRPTLPLDDGARVIALQSWDVSANRREDRVASDFVAWRDELTTVRELGAWRPRTANLITREARGEPVEITEMSAAGFRLTRVAPVLGRPLLPADEQAGAPPVVVMGYDVWQGRFNGDPAVIGTTLRLGTVEHTVVGVMPEGFAFPVSHSIWVPLQLDAAGYAPLAGPPISLFARLAPGASIEAAQAELTAVGQRWAADFPATHEHLRPRVLPYSQSVVNVSAMVSLALMAVNLPLVLLLALICANVALLMFARAATRESEIVVRSALGASRGRIVVQLFTEALVLASVASVVGLVAAGSALRWVLAAVEADSPIPFWFSGSLSFTTVLYAIGLTLFGAAIAGVLPALKVTRGMGVRLRAGTAGGGGLRFGGVWTFIIVTQVAVTVALPALTMAVQWESAKLRAVDLDFPDTEYLTARLELDRSALDASSGASSGMRGDTTADAFAARVNATYGELERRLLADPAVAGVTYGNLMPRMYHPYRLIELDEGGAAPLNEKWPNGYRVSSAHVDPDFFDVLDVPLLAGRRFHSGDLADGAGGVIVNQSFVKLVLGDRNPIGRRLRYVHLEEWDQQRPDAEEPGPWYEIVGVVPDMAQASVEDPKRAGFYHPATPADAYPMQLAVHLRGDPQAFEPRLRTLATAVEPLLRLHDATPLADLSATQLHFLRTWFRVLMLITSVALVLSLTAIYAVMSFTVSRRTREIGIRVALGAPRRRVVATIFRKPLAQIAGGIVAGAALLGVLVSLATEAMLSPLHVSVLVGYGMVMFAVCMLACIVPTQRALRVEPTEALRQDG